MFGKLLLLLSSNAGWAAIVFVRTIIVARLISVADFGIASTFMISVTVVQMMSNLGLNQRMIQDSRGNDPEFQKALQGFQLIRGLTGAVALFLLAKPMALFLGNGDLVWAYQTMALMPIFTGFRHFDMFRMQRQMNYRPFIICNLAGPLAALGLLFPLAWAFGDYRVLLFALLAQELITSGLSHVVAERPYRVKLDRSEMRESVQFGWPLLLNGVLLFLVFQGEKLVVGRELGMAALGIFTMAVSLVQQPSLNLQKATSQFVLPQLSATKDSDRAFDRMALITVQASLLGAVGLSVAIVLLGKPVVDLALGPHYAAAVPLLVLVSVVQAIRGARSCTAQVALARAKTGNALAGNLPRVVSIPLSWYVLAEGGGMDTVLGIAALAELLGFFLGLWLMKTRTGVALGPLWPSLLGFGLFLGALAVHGPLGMPADSGGLLPPEAETWVLTGATLVALATFWPLWRYLWQRQMHVYEDAEAEREQPAE